MKGDVDAFASLDPALKYFCFSMVLSEPRFAFSEEGKCRSSSFVTIEFLCRWHGISK